MSILNGSKELKPKLLATGDTHNIMVDLDDKVYIWGSSSYLIPEEGSKTFPTELSLEIKGIRDVKIKGSVNYLVTLCGKLFVWPQKSQGNFLNNLTNGPIQFPTNIIVSQISCSYHFVMILSKSGLLYSFGSDNKEGELGHGDKKSRMMPSLLESLALEKLDGVECGYKHVICKSTLGKVFTWGWGTKGQLGQGNLKGELTPKILAMTLGYNYNYKAIQIIAGYSCSAILMEDKRVFWCGSNGILRNEANFKEIEFVKRNKELNGILPVRLVCQWNKTSNVIFGTFADMRMMDFNVNLQNKILNNLINKWGNTSIYSIFPPFIESISKYFSPKTMKMESKHKGKRLKKVPIDKNIKERRNSSLEPIYKKEENNYSSKMLKEMKTIQIKSIKERMEKLKRLGKEKWNERDEEFVRMVKNSKIEGLFDLEV